MTHDSSLERSSIGRASRSAVGRVSGGLSRLVGGASTLKATGRFLRRQLWAWPMIAAALFGGAGWWVHVTVEDAMRRQRAADLNAMVDASVAAVRVWIDEQRQNVEHFTDDEVLSAHVAELRTLADGSTMAERRLAQAPAQDLLRARLKPKLPRNGYVGFFVVSPDGVVLAADQDPPVGKPLADYRKEIFDQAIAGQTLVSRPFRSPLLLTDDQGQLRANLPTMFTVGPIRDQAGKPIAALGLRIRPDDQFTRILQVVRFGESGETFAFDRRGLLLSQSRFDDQLKQIGLLADQPDAQSILTIEARDPGVNMTAGERPKARRHEQPLTTMAAAAARGEDGHEADGYRDYRGVPVVGAWRWLAEQDFGVVTEVDVAEAFAPVFILRRAFWTLMTLLGLSAAGIFIAMLVMARQQRALQQATLAAKQLGQYALDQKIGAGGMGTVYKAHHAMLRRPTAIKLLDIDKMTDAAIARFEREVRLTSALTHPNTVAIFDYGRTADGIFYYAMEYLEGMNLDDLVKRHGPLPQGRLVHVLRQVCGALSEAHAAGLVHRDIKPANIFLTRRGGMHDFVKVLDFGLVKSLDGDDQAHLTNPSAITGTPLYLAPEIVNQPDQVDARADVYAIGAVGYFLLTGSPVFSGTTIMDICMKHVHEAPTRPSERGALVGPDLEALLMACLAKSPARRPANAAELLRALDECRTADPWTAADAARWWSEHGDDGDAAATRDGSTTTNSAPTPDTTIAYHREPS